jgi:class 3 adenylate cyclase
MLRMLESLSLGPASVEQIARQLRRAHPLAASRRRVSGLLDLLVDEGLVEIGADDGTTIYRTTARGLESLQRQGRFPGASAVLFTDIVGSTELIGLHGEQGAHRLRQRHFELLRKQISRHDGREVKNLGDGLMVVFADPRAALRCAVAMQRAVARDRDRVGLRIGVNAGELLREGNDYFGTTVIVAQRLCDHADAGEIVVMRELLDRFDDDDAPPHEPLGEIELKGLDAPLQAAAITWSRAVETAHHSLAQMSSTPVRAALDGAS